MTSTAAPRWLAGFPRSLADLPTSHRVVLALLLAYQERRDTPLPWATLADYAQASSALENDAALLARDLGRGMLRQLALVVGDLVDYGLVEASANGLAVTPTTRDAIPSWNGEFQSLVEAARHLVDVVERSHNAS